MAGSATASKLTPHAVDDDVREPVKEELSRILQHPLFKDTTRMKRFLRYVVEETLAGRDDRLKGYSIGLEVFDRPDDFDPQADTIVRVQAGQLRRRLDLYYAGDGRSNPVRILIPKGRYAPVFEMRKEVDPSEAKPMATVAKIEWQNRPGIAVLTFQNLSSSAQERDYFAEGVTAEIVNALVQFRYMRIVSRNATIMGQEDIVDLTKIAEKYDVQFVLTGNVRRAGNLIRVSVNLLSTESGEHIYSKIFDRECTPENLFEIQEEIASYVAVSVAAPFGAVNRYNRRLNSGRLSSLSSYESFLKYYEMNLSPTENKARELLEEFKVITEKTPRFSSAWAIWSSLNTFLVAQCMTNDDPDARLADAISAGTRASAIDPENALAFYALFQAYFHSGEIEMAEKMAQQSMILNPNDYNMLAYYAVTQAYLDNQVRALSYQTAAMDLLARPPKWFYLSSLICAFQNGEFEKVFELTNSPDPNGPAAIHMMAISCAGHLGDHEWAERGIALALETTPDYFKHGRKMGHYWQANSKFLELSLDGWRKAGVDIAD